MTLEQAILNKFLAEASITSLVTPKSIYAGIIPISAKLPAIMFVTQSIPEKVRTFDSCAFPTALVRVYCWGENYTGARALCEVVRSVFEGVTGMLSGLKVLVIFAESEQDIYDETGESFGRSLDLIIKYVEPA